MLQRLQDNFEKFYSTQLQERMQYHYPPYTRLIQITLKHKDIKNTIEAANKLYTYLDTKFQGWVIGPNAPIIQKVNNYYIRDILIKILRDTKELSRIKRDIQQAIEGLYQFQSFKQLRITIDVDVY